jgi:hypothetical protein
MTPAGTPIRRLRQIGRCTGAATLTAILAMSLASCSTSTGPGSGQSTKASSSTTSTSAARTSSGATLTGSTCALNPATSAITGPLGSASEIGWAGNDEGVVTCLGGSFYVQDGINQTFGFGIYTGGITRWVDAEGYLPAQVTSFHHDGADVVITEFADQVDVGGNSFVAVYCRVSAANRTASMLTADPEPTPGLIPLDTAPDTLAPRADVVHDYVIAVDRFGNFYPWPSAQALAAAGGFDEHFAHMKAFWDGQLAQIAGIRVPDAPLVDAYRSGFIYTQIARSGTHLDTGVNGYEEEYSHDVIGILANLFTQGYFTDAQALLLEARDVVGSQGQYEDGIWTYSWPWAIYVLKTGDLSFAEQNFSTPGPNPATEPSIEQTAHQIAADRTGPDGIIGATDDVDTNGLWTVDDYEALTGLAAYHFLAGRLGDTVEATWASNEYDSLLAAVDQVLSSTIRRYHLTYLPCSMVQPNSANRCNNPEDANWAAPFLFGRWAWDAQLFGATVEGPGLQLIDATYAHGFARLRGKLPPDTFGGYPGDYFSTAYNAGYGSWGLASAHYRDEAVLAYQFMIASTQSGPYSWWESASAPAVSPWAGVHPAGGQGSSPHAWGIADANKALLDSLVAERSDGVLLVGRGVPNSWLAPGKVVAVTNFPTTEGARISVIVTAGTGRVALEMTGALPSAQVAFELPQFVDNLATTTAGHVVESTGTVWLPAGTRKVTVSLRHPVG